MDKVKAIKVLKPLVDSYVDYANITMKEEDDDIVDALEMAIEALKALDVPDMNVGDMISRQMAIDSLHGYFDGMLETDTWSPCDVYGLIELLPSAQPERKKGEWILQSDDHHEYYECDQCGICVGLFDVRNFCCNCGADMRGERDG